MLLRLCRPMPELLIKHESLPERCDICHQSDRFDPIANHCLRCASAIAHETAVTISQQAAHTAHYVQAYNRHFYNVNFGKELCVAAWLPGNVVHFKRHSNEKMMLYVMVIFACIFAFSTMMMFNGLASLMAWAISGFSVFTFMWLVAERRRDIFFDWGKRRLIVSSKKFKHFIRELPFDKIDAVVISKQRLNVNGKQQYRYELAVRSGGRMITISRTALFEDPITPFNLIQPLAVELASALSVNLETD